MRPDLLARDAPGANACDVGFNRVLTLTTPSGDGSFFALHQVSSGDYKFLGDLKFELLICGFRKNV